LQIQPKFWRRAQCLRHQHRRFERNASASMNDFIYHLQGDAKMLGKGPLRDSGGLKKFLQEHFTRRRRQSVFRRHVF
jgi:hypothetical protein